VITVLFCAFNEERVIRPTLAAVDEALSGTTEPYRVVLVDDGSSDRTVAEADAAVTGTDGRLELVILSHAVNEGLGAALRTGIFWFLDRATERDVLVTLDADNTHPPALIPGMVDRLGSDYDLVIASRYRRGAKVEGVPGHRRMLSDVGRLVFQATFPIRGVRDYTCCFRAYRADILQRARLVYGDELCTARGFEAVLDLLLRLRQLGLRATEVPIDLRYAERVGQSKMKVVRTIRSTLALLARRFTERWTVYSPARVRARLTVAEGAPR
jgi:dolichol-phosphate mannosyltransferase